jgi:hypothetical protein
MFSPKEEYVAAAFDPSSRHPFSPAAEPPGYRSFAVPELDMAISPTGPVDLLHHKADRGSNPLNTANQRWGVVRMMSIIAMVGMAMVSYHDPVEAQPTGFLIDHLKLYEMDPTLFIEGEPVVLRDQFNGYVVNVTSPSCCVCRATRPV